MASEMQPLTLRVAVGEAGVTAALREGRVPTGPLRLEFAQVETMIGAYRRMVRTQEYDACELPIVTCLLARAAGRPFTALPIFLRHGFFHHWLVCRADSPIAAPREIEGRRVGVRAYTVTPPTWARGVLAAEYGVDLDRVTWLTDDEEHVTEYQPPPNVMAAPGGAKLSTLFKAGDIEVAFQGPAGIGPMDEGTTRPLIADPHAAAAEWCRRTGIYPFQNVIVVRDSLLAEHPGLARALFDVFNRARQQYLGRLEASGPANADEAALLRRREFLGDDLLPWGVQANQRALDTITAYAVAQHILPRPLPAAELFPSDTLAWQ